MGGLLWIVMLLSLFVGQLIFPALAFFHFMRPDLLGIFVIIWGFRRGPAAGVAAGLSAGLLQDAAGSLIVFHTVFLAAAGGLAGLARDSVVDFSPAAMPLVVTAAVALVRTAEIVGLGLTRFPLPAHSASAILIASLLNLLMALWLYPLTLRLERQVAPPALEFGGRHLLN